MRHAKAEHNSSINDYDRSLSNQGINDAIKAGYFLKEAKEIPQIILCSSSLRTKQTLESLEKGIGAEIPFVLLETLYRADLNIINQMILNIEEQFSSAMIISHNPGVFDFSVKFATNSPKEKIVKLSMGFGAANVACFAFNCNKWQEISPANAEMNWFFNFF